MEPINNVNQVNISSQIKDSFTINKVDKISSSQTSSAKIEDIFQPQISKEEAIKQIDDIIKQKENELKNIDQEIQKLTSSRVLSSNSPELNKYLQALDQIKLENLNMQKNSIQNQIQVLNQRKQELEKQKQEEEKNLQTAIQNLKNNYQISIDQLNNLKKQLELYQTSMNVNYQKQIEALNNEISRLQKEIEDLLNQHPSTPEEAEQIAQKIAEKRNLINTLKGQIDVLSQEIANLNNQINQQVLQLDQQIMDIKKQMQIDFYNKWAMEQAIRREIEQIIWTEMLNEKNHVANLWKMYWDTNNKLRDMWKEMYLKKVADNSSFAAQWAKAIGA